MADAPKILLKQNHPPLRNGTYDHVCLPNYHPIQALDDDIQDPAQGTTQDSLLEFKRCSQHGSEKP